MRTEAKLGLAVGVILLAVAVAYVLIPSRKKVVQEVPPLDVANEPAVVDSNANRPPVPAAPTTTESLAAGPTTAPATAPVAATPASQPTATVVAIAPGPGAVVTDNASAGTQDPWPRALSDGQIRGQGTVTQTPAAAQPTMDALAAVDSAASTTRPTGLSHKHVVKQGETFRTIALAEYGDAKYYQRIARANPKVNPNRLRVGQTLVLPELSDNSAAASPVSSVSSSSAGLGFSTTTAPAGSSLAAIDDSSSTYKVQAGDTLYRISLKLYGKPEMWQKIYELNKAAIGPDSGRLKLNMVLKLPGAPTAH